MLTLVVLLRLGLSLDNRTCVWGTYNLHTVRPQVVAMDCQTADCPKLTLDRVTNDHGLMGHKRLMDATEARSDRRPLMCECLTMWQEVRERARGHTGPVVKRQVCRSFGAPHSRCTRIVVALTRTVDTNSATLCRVQKTASTAWNLIDHDNVTFWCTT